MLPYMTNSCTHTFLIIHVCLCSALIQISREVVLILTDVVHFGIRYPFANQNNLSFG